VSLVRGKRLRRRGPRSQIACLRRSVSKQHRTPPGISPGESGDLIPDISDVHTPCDNSNASCNPFAKCMPRRPVRNTCREGILVYSVNIRCMLSNLQLLLNQLEQHRPHIVLIQETWLDKSVEKIAVVGYTEVSRRDRKETANRGGIVTLQRSDFNGLVHIKTATKKNEAGIF
jgi:hypothetical protein